jgi:hypothetical protein
MLHSPDDPANLTPDQRRHEIAAVFARGVLRLHGTGRGERSRRQANRRSATRSLSAQVFPPRCGPDLAELEPGQPTCAASPANSTQDVVDGFCYVGCLLDRSVGRRAL